MKKVNYWKQLFLYSIVILFCHGMESQASNINAPNQTSIFNVKDFGAIGFKYQSSKETTLAIQAAIDSCFVSGGGMVYVGPGEYVTGSISLRSNVHFFLEAGAVIYGSRDTADWDRGRRAILHGIDLTNIMISGKGTIDGDAVQKQFPYELKNDDEIQYRIDALVRENPGEMPFWKWLRPTYNLIYLRNCTDITVRDVSLINSPVWCVHFLGCERVVVDGVYVFSSLEKGVNSDGINPNGCKDVRISNCTIVTGDDCISIKSGSRGVNRPSENITITNCTLTSASSAVKIGDEITADVKHVLINNCVIRDSHRAFAFMIFDGGTVSDVIISNITVECSRHDWFWWGQGDAFYFKIAKRNEGSKIGKFENILIKDVIAHVKGSSIIKGVSSSPIKGLRMENVKFFLSDDTTAYFREAIHAVEAQFLSDFQMKDVSIVWEKPISENWKSALLLQDVEGLLLDGFSGKQGLDSADEPVIVFKNVDNAVVRNCRAQKGTKSFIMLSGNNNKKISLVNNDFSYAKEVFRKGSQVKTAVNFSSGNYQPE